MEALTRDAVKKYMRLDTDEEDAFIDDLIEYSKEEFKNSTGDDGSNPSYTYRMAQLLIITTRFENRANEEEFKINNALSCLYTKLKYRSEENAGNSEQIAKQS